MAYFFGHPVGLLSSYHYSIPETGSKTSKTSIAVAVDDSTINIVIIILILIIIISINYLLFTETITRVISVYFTEVLLTAWMNERLLKFCSMS